MSEVKSEKEIVKTAPFLYKIENGKAVLVGNKCTKCGHEMFPAQEQCSDCLSHDVVPFELPSEGVVYSCATIQGAPAGFEGPYTLSYGDFGDFRIYGMISNKEKPQIGDKIRIVEGELRQDEEKIYLGYQFEIVKEDK